MTAWVVKLAAEVEFFIALTPPAPGVGAWKVALADELSALGDGAGNVGGRPGEPFPRRPYHGRKTHENKNAEVTHPFTHHLVKPC